MNSEDEGPVEGEPDVPERPAVEAGEGPAFGGVYVWSGDEENGEGEEETDADRG